MFQEILTGALVVILIWIGYLATWRILHPRRSSRDKLVLITGAGHGIGRLLALKFAQQGARLALWDIQPELLRAVEQEVLVICGNSNDTHTTQQQRVQSFIVDVASREQVATASATVLNNMGVVDILINNAGVVNGLSFLDLSHEDIQRTFNVNALAPLWTLKSFLPRMMSRNSGHVVSIASAAAYSYATGLSDYCASKAALVAFHHSLRLELRKCRSKVHSTLVLPYHIDTGMFHNIQINWLVRTLFPTLKAEEVAEKILIAIERKQHVLTLPYVLSWLIPLLLALPVTVCDWITEFVGGKAGMDSYTGHGNVLLRERHSPRPPPPSSSASS